MPKAIREFGVRDFAWAIHRTIYLEQIDAVQLEYTILGQYAGEYRHIPCMLFEHDISMQSLWRRIRAGSRDADLVLEYLRMRVYEPRLLRRVTRVQVCSENNARYLVRRVSQLRGRIDPDVRAGIDVSRYEFGTEVREKDTLLFIGSFRHSPNVDALRWFTTEVFPAILKEKPAAVLMIVGSDPPESSTVWNDHPNIRLLGSVPDVKVQLECYSVFICPILSGSGVRVKLLEAFASGIAAVSTSVGAEGLTSRSGEVCEIADSPDAFAGAVLRLLNDEAYRMALAQRARGMVEEARDSRQAIARLAGIYRAEVNRMRGPRGAERTAL